MILLCSASPYFRLRPTMYSTSCASRSAALGQLNARSQRIGRGIGAHPETSISHLRSRSCSFRISADAFFSTRRCLNGRSKNCRKQTPRMSKAALPSTKARSPAQRSERACPVPHDPSCCQQPEIRSGIETLFTRGETLAGGPCRYRSPRCRALRVAPSCAA